MNPQPPQSLQDADKYPPGWESATTDHSIFITAPPPRWGLREVTGGRLEIGDYIQAARQSDGTINVWAVYVGRTKSGALGHAAHGGNTSAFREDDRLMAPEYRFLVRRHGPRFNEWGEDSL